MKLSRSQTIRLLIFMAVCLLPLLFVLGTMSNHRLDCYDATGRLVQSSTTVRFIWEKDLRNRLEQYATANGHSRVVLTVFNWNLNTQRYSYSGP